MLLALVQNFIEILLELRPVTQRKKSYTPIFLLRRGHAKKASVSHCQSFDVTVVGLIKSPDLSFIQKDRKNE